MGGGPSIAIVETFLLSDSNDLQFHGPDSSNTHLNPPITMLNDRFIQKAIELNVTISNRETFIQNRKQQLKKSNPGNMGKTLSAEALNLGLSWKNIKDMAAQAGMGPVHDRNAGMILGLEFYRLFVAQYFNDDDDDNDQVMAEAAEEEPPPITQEEIQTQVQATLQNIVVNNESRRLQVKSEFRTNIIERRRQFEVEEKNKNNTIYLEKEKEREAIKVAVNCVESFKTFKNGKDIYLKDVMGVAHDSFQIAGYHDENKLRELVEKTMLLSGFGDQCECCVYTEAKGFVLYEDNQEAADKRTTTVAVEETCQFCERIRNGDKDEHLFRHWQLPDGTNAMVVKCHRCAHIQDVYILNDAKKMIQKNGCDSCPTKFDDKRKNYYSVPKSEDSPTHPMHGGVVPELSSRTKSKDVNHYRLQCSVDYGDHPKHARGEYARGECQRLKKSKSNGIPNPGPPLWESESFFFSEYRKDVNWKTVRTDGWYTQIHNKIKLYHKIIQNGIQQYPKDFKFVFKRDPNMCSATVECTTLHRITGSFGRKLCSHHQHVYDGQGTWQLNKKCCSFGECEKQSMKNQSTCNDHPKANSVTILISTKGSKNFSSQLMKSEYVEQNGVKGKKFMIPSSWKNFNF